MRRFKLSKVIVVALAVFLLVLPLVGCAKKAPPPPLPPPPAGTISIQPAKIDQAMLKPLLPAVAKAAGLPEAAAAALPPCLSILAIPVNFSGSGWSADEPVFIDLVIPPGVEVKGLTPGEDSVGIAFAKADAAGKFEVTMEATAKLNWLLNTDWLPTVKPDLTKIRPLPNRVYTIRATGVDPLTVVTTTWELELIAPPSPPPTAPPATPPAGGKLPFEAAEYSNAEYGFSIKYPKDWQVAPPSKTLITAQKGGLVPAMFVGAVDGADFAEAVSNTLKLADGTDIKVGAVSEVTLADGSKGSKAGIEATLKGFPAKGLAIGAKPGAKWIVCAVGTVEMLAPYDEVLFTAIGTSIQFKK